MRVRARATAPTVGLAMLLEAKWARSAARRCDSGKLMVRHSLRHPASAKG